MRRTLGGLILAAAMLAPAAAQDAVRLRNGRFLAGKIVVDEADKDGFRVESWDSGSVLFVRWTQLPDAERNRLLGRNPDASAGGSSVPMIDGIRVVTTSREETGALVREDANQILIKTRASKSPIVIPKNDNLLRRDHPIKVRESDAYSPEEMIDARLARAVETDYASMLQVARFAAGLRMFERAKELYQKAAAAPNANKDEINEILARNEALIKEGKAGALLEEIRKFVEETEYAKAIEAARRLLAEFADTDVARSNSGLVGTIEKEAKEWEVRKADILAVKVPELYKAKRMALISAAAGSRNKIAEARAQTGKLDEEVVKALSAQLKSTQEEIQAAWAKREQKQRTATFGSGSWIAKGAQDGGLDTDQKGQPRQTQQMQNQGNRGGFGNMQGNRNSRNNPQQPKEVVLGKKLETSTEWWTSASSSERKAFLEAEYAKNSSAVNKEVKSKKCSLCVGEGTFKGTRMGYEAEWKCARCHGAKEDEIVVYW